MALQHGHESDAEEYHSLPPQDDDRDNDSLNDAASGAMEPPIHPVPSMQGAFEESIIESTEEPNQSLKSPEDPNPEVRRRALLEAHRYDPSWKTRWKQRPSAVHHPLRKLMAQILFGMHLLQQNQAKSNDEVIKILQTHVDEVDTFLERTGDDFDCAIADIDERIHHLELPMAHLDVFKSMLEDKPFRSQLLNGNDKIEKIVDRTARAAYAALADVHQGIGANRELRTYLDSTEDLWPQDEPGIADVCTAMRGNEQGWMRYLDDLLVKGDTLNRLLIQLGTITGEMSRLAASASRRNKSSAGQSTSSTSKSTAAAGLRSKFYRDKSAPATSNLNKPLPRDPARTNNTRQVTPKQHPIPLAERYESPRERVPAPKPSSGKDKSRSNKDVVPVRRPKTAGSASRNERDSSADLAEFLRSSGPLSSNPPAKKQARSQSQGAAEIMKDIQKMDAKKTVRRSQSQTALEALNQQSMNRSDTRPGSRGADKALGIQKESTLRRLSMAIRGRDHNKSESVASNSSVHRRLSKRPKQTAAPPPAPRVEAIQRAAAPEQSPLVDSAYSSGTDKKAPPAADEPVPEVATPERPPSRLSLFPKPSPPLERPVADIPKPTSPLERPVADIPKRSGSLGANMALRSPTAQPQDSKRTPGRTLSIRHIFHRRQKTEGFIG